MRPLYSNIEYCPSTSVFFFDDYRTAQLRISFPQARSHGSFRWVHLNWKPKQDWDRMSFVRCESKHHYTQILHPFGHRGQSCMSQAAATISLTFVDRARAWIRIITSSVSWATRTNSALYRNLARVWFNSCERGHYRCRYQGASAGLSWTSIWLLQLDTRKDGDQIVHLNSPNNVVEHEQRRYITKSLLGQRLYRSASCI